MKSLSKLLKECDKLWEYDIPVAFVFNYTLAKFPAGWQFNVTNGWQNWTKAGFKDSFGMYSEPEYAVIAFLEYVKENNIDVKSFAERTTLEEFDKILKKYE